MESELMNLHTAFGSIARLFSITSAHPQTASFGPERRFRSFEILDIARYASGFKIAQALL